VTTNDDGLTVRRTRIAPGVRESNARWQESKPESPHAAQRRAAREYAELMADYDSHPERYAREVPCIHPGVFSRHVPGDPVAFNATEHCWQCGTDVPAGEL
jgi:hypothetical protein